MPTARVNRMQIATTVPSRNCAQLRDKDRQPSAKAKSYEVLQPSSLRTMRSRRAALRNLLGNISQLLPESWQTHERFGIWPVTRSTWTMQAASPAPVGPRGRLRHPHVDAYPAALHQRPVQEFLELAVPGERAQRHQDGIAHRPALGTAHRTCAGPMKTQRARRSRPHRRVDRAQTDLINASGEACGPPRPEQARRAPVGNQFCLWRTLKWLWHEPGSNRASGVLQSPAAQIWLTLQVKWGSVARRAGRGQRPKVGRYDKSSQDERSSSK
jgi:hypothetical protein